MASDQPISHLSQHAAIYQIISVDVLFQSTFETPDHPKCHTCCTCWWILLTTWFMILYIIFFLTHWGRVTHICIGKLTMIGSDNCLSPGRRQAVIWTHAGILLIRTLGTNFSETLSKIHSFSCKKMHLKMSSANGRLFTLGLNELTSSSYWGVRHRQRREHDFEYRWPCVCMIPCITETYKVSDEITYPFPLHRWSL